MESERKTRGRGRPRGGTLVDEQERFGRLIAQGVRNSQACRIVGIDRRTGTRWRSGRVVVAPFPLRSMPEWRRLSWL
ncbi:hypothetical protein LAUMK191_05623 [Mycobacterium attenuatum]|uniref:Helix-turn-helix domain-containing protein n=1 Tax=Mycobacterium attenuatum TaxID=2341086 RepID=A0A498Q0N6_9MYCO|nr:hypothetical protein LAUMK136_02671 [Mycobacterium attenuatum]VBA60628.1 hypothetical protein LAUMK191_05623 [Mycobacterium attenuatum]VBA62375.1 hypothetical protein LAUMK41_05766 [Mycobacterium attenuatum]